jgi:thiol:disulfide interchange protein DsbD
MAALALALGTAYLSLAPAVAHPKREQQVSSAEAFTPQALEKHLASGRVVLVDFTADWCLTCKANERLVLGSQSVQDTLHQTNAVVLRADWTDGDDQLTALIHKFGRSGVPLYVIFSPNRPDQPLVLPEVLTPQIVVDGLHEAARP